MLPNKAALYKQRHCLQGFVRTKALLAAEFFHTICAGVCRVIKLPHDRSSTGVRARYRVYKLPVAVDLRWKAPCKGTRTLEQSLVCYTSPGGFKAGPLFRVAVKIASGFKVCVVFPYHLIAPCVVVKAFFFLLFQIFNGALLNAAIAVPCVPASAA